MVNCDNFVHFMVEDDEDLDSTTREALHDHARTCEGCYRVQRGYRAYVSYREGVANGAPRRKSAPWVKESIVKAANEAIDRLEEADRNRSIRRTRVRHRVIALAAIAAEILIGGSAILYVQKIASDEEAEGKRLLEEHNERDQHATLPGLRTRRR